MKVTIWWPMYTVDDKGEDVETIYDIVCELTPGEPDVPYLKNGDPGYPGSPDECEILSIGLQGLANQPAIDLKPVLWPLLGFNAKVMKEIEAKAWAEAPSKEDDDDPRGWEPRNVYQHDDPHDD